MSRKKIQTQKEENQDLFFKKLPSENREPELWPITTEGELAVDVYETKRDVVIKAAIAGIKPEDLNLSLEGDLLTVRGTRQTHERSDGIYLCKECHWGSFSRSIILPTNVKTDKVKAQLERGVLTISLPKAKKEIDIKVEEVEE